MIRDDKNTIQVEERFDGAAHFVGPLGDACF